MSNIQKREEKCAKALVGKTIKEVRYLSDLEAAGLGWSSKALVLFFNDGSYIYASADDEGNNAGALFTSMDDLPIIPVI